MTESPKQEKVMSSPVISAEELSDIIGCSVEKAQEICASLPPEVYADAEKMSDAIIDYVVNHHHNSDDFVNRSEILGNLKDRIQKGSDYVITTQDVAQYFDIPLSVAQYIMRIFADEVTITNFADFVEYVNHILQETAISPQMAIKVAGVIGVSYEDVAVLLSADAMMDAFDLPQSSAELLIEELQNDNSLPFESLWTWHNGQEQKLIGNLWASFLSRGKLSSRDIIHAFHKEEIKISEELAAFLISENYERGKRVIKDVSKFKEFLNDIGDNPRGFLKNIFRIIQEELQEKLEKQRLGLRSS